MTLNASGPISLGGAITGESTNLEVGNSATTQLAFNDTKVRTLTGTTAGTALIMPTNFYGKTNPFPGGNVSYTDLASVGAAMVLASNTTATAGGTLTLNSVSLGSYDYAIQSATTVSSFTNSTWYTTTQDTRSALIAIKGNFTINSGVLFTPSNRKLFTFIYVNGNLTMNGEISMTNMAANASGTGNSSGGTTSANILIYSGTHGGISNPQIPSNGGTGTAGQSAGCPGSPANPAGGAGSSGGTGGGGGGGNCGSVAAGSGATGSAFAGGPGGGAINNGGTSVPAGNGTYNGGRGGDASTGSVSGGAGGGAGQPGGSSYAGGTDGATGCAGVIIIICTGTISGSGTFSSIGGYGGDAGHASGGSGGGGSINIMYGSNSSSYTLDASGGPQNTTSPYGRNGGAGGAGTARLIAI
jgi:hypothetical protein